MDEKEKGGEVPILAKEYPHYKILAQINTRTKEKIQKRENITSHSKVCMEDIHSIIWSI